MDEDDKNAWRQINCSQDLLLITDHLKLSSEVSNAQQLHNWNGAPLYLSLPWTGLWGSFWPLFIFTPAREYYVGGLFRLTYPMVAQWHQPLADCTQRSKSLAQERNKKHRMLVCCSGMLRLFNEERCGIICFRGSIEFELMSLSRCCHVGFFVQLSWFELRSSTHICTSHCREESVCPHHAPPPSSPLSRLSYSPTYIHYVPKWSIWFYILLLTWYSWIRHPVWTHKKKYVICRETEKATTDLNTWMKSSRPGAFTGGVPKFIFSFFGKLFLKNRGYMP